MPQICSPVLCSSGTNISLLISIEVMVSQITVATIANHSQPRRMSSKTAMGLCAQKGSTMKKAQSIILWTHPRSISTAFERYFLERQDFQVFHEEFGAVHFADPSTPDVPHANFPDNFLTSYEEIREMMEHARLKGPVFLKEMSYHAFKHVTNDSDYLADKIHIFLVRNPDDTILSHATVDPNLKHGTLGYAELPTLFEHCYQATNRCPLVIDSDDLINNTKDVFQRVCQYANIPFKPEALKWKASMPKQWETWRVWHKEAAQSNGFSVPSRKYSVSFETNPELIAMADYCRPFYTRMRAFVSTNINELSAER